MNDNSKRLPVLAEKLGIEMKAKATRFSMGMLAMLIIAGCSSMEARTHKGVWSYQAEPPVTSVPLINKSVAVSPLSDKRKTVNNTMVSMFLIPLMPFGWQDLEIPEGSDVVAHMATGRWAFRPTDNFARAIAEELNNSGIFREAFFTDERREGDLLLHGEIKSTHYNGKMITYGLSIFAPSVWLIGFPAAHVNNVLTLSLQLVDSKTNEVLWAGNYEKKDGNTSWIYSLKLDFLYHRLLKEIMKEVITSLKNEFASYQK